MQAIEVQDECFGVFQGHDGELALEYVLILVPRVEVGDVLVKHRGHDVDQAKVLAYRDIDIRRIVKLGEHKARLTTRQKEDLHDFFTIRVHILECGEGPRFE